MTRDVWDDRRRGLEEEFFTKKNRELIAKIRADEEHKEARDVLEREIGIHDPEVLDSLVAAQITPSTMLALAAVPLVFVAWADGAVAREEKEAILKAAHEQGMTEGASSYELLASWLSDAPSETLFAAWRHYVDHLRATMDPTAFAKLRSDIMERARRVAAATGGFLGFIGHMISDAEKLELQRFERVFEGSVASSS